MGLINLKTDLKSLKYGYDRPGGGSSNQPYIVTPIPNGLTANGPDFLLRQGSLQASVRDIERLTRFFTDTTSVRGLLFTAKQELLERVLLMMNYDSSKTLNENTQLITEQYAWPSVLQQGLELSKTRAFSGPKWETYLNGLMATTLPDLMKIQKGFSDAGYGAISPDFGLQGFNKPNPTPASIVLENDIYVKSLKNYENRKSKGLNAGIKPTGPQSTLIPEVPVQMKNLFGKTSGQLLHHQHQQ